MNYHDYMYNLEKLDVYVDSKTTPSGRIDIPENLCGSISRLNDALFQPVLHLQCNKAIRGRFIYIEASGVSTRWNRLFSAVLCEVMAYQ
jgi:hypothetical protein